MIIEPARATPTFPAPSGTVDACLEVPVPQICSLRSVSVLAIRPSKVRVIQVPFVFYSSYKSAVVGTHTGLAPPKEESMRRMFATAALVLLSTVALLAAVTVTVSPRTVTLQAGSTQQFTRTLAFTQWWEPYWYGTGTAWRASCGTITSNGFYTAPAAISTCTVTATHTRTGASGSAVASITVPVPPEPDPDPDPPPTTGDIWGIVDPSTLGTCSADDHDKWVVNIGKPVLLRTWHPQVDPSGCVYAHEHGDNPARMTNAEISAEPVAFGLIGYVHGHEEPHEGFKVFALNPGETNDEGRTNLVWSRSTFHMGTGGPARFTTQFHSASIRLVHQNGMKAFTHLMMNTGGPFPAGVNTVCDPRVPAPTKDVIRLDSPCKLGSAYEIWSTFQDVRNASGQVVYRSFATPAVFDPITVFNPANPSEVVYAWDPRVAAIKQFTDNWSWFRGCSRESYAQPGYFYNGSGGALRTYWTDAFGQPRPSTDPAALRQDISAHSAIGVAASNDGNIAFKKRVNYCAPGLGLKN